MKIMQLTRHPSVFWWNRVMILEWTWRKNTLIKKRCTANVIISPCESAKKCWKTQSGHRQGRLWLCYWHWVGRQGLCTKSKRMWNGNCNLLASQMIFHWDTFKCGLVNLQPTFALSYHHIAHWLQLIKWLSRHIWCCVPLSWTKFLNILKQHLPNVLTGLSGECL